MPALVQRTVRQCCSRWQTCARSVRDTHCSLAVGCSASGCQLVSVRVHTCTHTQVHTHTHTHCVVGQRRNMVLRIMHDASGLSSACKEASMHAQTACYIPLPVMTVLSWSMPHTMGSVHMHRTCGWISARVCGLCLCVQTFTEELQVALSPEKHSE